MIVYEYEILILENKLLVCMFYDVVEIDDLVLVEYWEVVVEIISFVMVLKIDLMCMLLIGLLLCEDFE